MQYATTTPSDPSKPARSDWRRQLALMLASTAAVLVTLPSPAQVVVDPPPVPKSLKLEPVPVPSTLSAYVFDRTAAARLGKALFWDMQVGSDGKTACASCHFHAGADNRSRNQISPGLLRMSSPTTANPDTTFQVGGPNYQLKLSDFPFHQLSDPRVSNSTVLRTANDVSSSQGAFNERFVGVTPGAGQDTRAVVFDPVFHVGAANTRRVEPRNTPTVINAVFNFRNFWDGRAQYLFNGVNPFGARDANARVYKYDGVANMSAVQVLLDNASLASQASGPPLSNFEMSADGRSFMALGKRLLTARPLALQKVDPTDSRLGPWVARNALGVPTTGLANFAGSQTATYEAMVKAAFWPTWWGGKQIVRVNADGSRTLMPANTVKGANDYAHMEANFSLIFGLALQLYQATLVSDDSPFDRALIGDALAMTAAQKAGMGLFFGKGKCADCHGGAEFTNASVSKTVKLPLSRMVMGDGGISVYDEGFYNIGITKTLDDILNGGTDPFGKPLSLTGLAQRVGNAEFQRIIGITPNLTVAAGERITANGAAKVPTVRNVELTAPYFHNGSVGTLRQVVEFYNRGGNFAVNNLADLDIEIRPLGLTEVEITQLVDFLHALTDQRVRLHQAPFDHPQLLVPHGHVGSTTAVTADGSGRATDIVQEVPAVGALGYVLNRTAVPANFLNTALSGSPVVNLQAKSSGLCAQVGPTTFLSPVTMQTCTSANNQRFKLVAGDYGQLMLVSQDRDAKLAPYGALSLDGTFMTLGNISAAYSVGYELFRVIDAGGGYHRIYNWLNGLCLDAAGGSLTPGANLVQRACSSASPAQQLFKLVGAS